MKFKLRKESLGFVYFFKSGTFEFSNSRSTEEWIRDRADKTTVERIQLQI